MGWRLLVFLWCIWWYVLYVRRSGGLCFHGGGFYNVLVGSSRILFFVVVDLMLRENSITGCGLWL